jgi:hypothetical protein
VLDEQGLPLAVGETPAAPGLRFIGFLSRPALIAFVAKQSKRVANRIADELAVPYGDVTAPSYESPPPGHS